MNQDFAPVFAPEVALERLDQDQALLGEVIGLLLEDAPEQLAALRAAADLRSLERAAHGFRGAVSNVGGVRLTVALRDLEDAARKGASESVGPLTARVEGAWAELSTQLLRWQPS